MQDGTQPSEGQTEAISLRGREGQYSGWPRAAGEAALSSRSAHLGGVRGRCRACWGQLHSLPRAPALLQTRGECLSTRLHHGADRPLNLSEPQAAEEMSVCLVGWLPCTSVLEKVKHSFLEYWLLPFFSISLSLLKGEELS